MSMDHTPLEAALVAAFGFDRPEGSGAGRNGANGEVSTPVGGDVSLGGDNGSGGRTAEQLAWLASWWAGWCTDNDEVLPKLADLGGFLIEVKRALLGVSDAADWPLPTPGVPVNPDCRDGKHRACNRDAWDDRYDIACDCYCSCHYPDDSVPF